MMSLFAKILLFKNMFFIMLSCFYCFIVLVSCIFFFFFYLVKIMYSVTIVTSVSDNFL